MKIMQLDTGCYVVVSSTFEVLLTTTQKIRAEAFMAAQYK